MLTLTSRPTVPALAPVLFLAIFTVLLLAPAPSVRATDDALDLARVRYDGHRIVRIVVETRDELDRVVRLGAEPWPCRFGAGPVDFRVSPETLVKLEAAGITHTVRITDLQTRVDDEQRRLAATGRAGGFFDDFRTYAEINARMDLLADERPELVTKLELGTTYEGRPVYGLRISGSPGEKPAVLLNGCQHAREWLAVMVPVYVADALVQRYDDDAYVRALLDAVEVFVVPIVNPDGYVYSWSGARYWRKNRRQNDGSPCPGVDLNRNWGVAWGGGESTDDDPCSNVFFGEGPFSEPESALMRDFVDQHPQLRYHVDFHTYGQLILRPWGHTFAPPPGVETVDALGNAMSAAMQSVNGRPWPSGPAGELLYLASGVFPDWTFGERGMLAYTIELTGNDFVVSPAEILPTGEEGLAAALTLMEWAATPARFELTDPVPAFVSAGTSVRFCVIDPDGVVDVGTVTAWVDVGDGFVARAAARIDDGIGDDTFAFTFPGALCGTRVAWYLSAVTEDGTITRAPFMAPQEVFEAVAHDILDVPFRDTFDTDQGWTVVNSVPFGDGAWERGAPAGTGQQGDPLQDADGSGACYLTGNAPGNSDVDFGSTTLISPRMDARGHVARLAYDRWYSNVAGSTAENDVLVVEVSDDDGASWHVLETVGPGGPEVRGGWFGREWVIAELPSVQGTDAFRVRFTASDNVGAGLLGSAVEAAVDHVRIVRRSCACTSDLDGDGLVSFDDLLAVLEGWGPCGSATCAADVDGDGTVGFGDLTVLLGGWGPC